MSQEFEHEELLEEEVGLTSEEAGASEIEPEDHAEEHHDDDHDEEDSEDKKSKLLSMTVFEVMLLVSFVCVSLATLMMFLELSTFGGTLSGFPWRTSEVLVK